MTTAASSPSSFPSAWPRGAPDVGQRALRSRTVQARDIRLFTLISGDRNPLHYDLVINTGSLGIEDAADMICLYLAYKYDLD